ncbi:MAG: RNA 2',3'-cyclic phosphodiesterase [Alphaproteobacteria bacterium]
MAEQFSFAGMSGDPTDRLFLATFPTEAAVRDIANLQARLKQSLGLWGKPLTADRLHITLCHLGDYAGLNDDVVTKARQAMAGQSFAPFDVTFDRVASFANRARNKPFVLQGKEGVAATEAFQKQLCDQLKGAGLGKWAKPYTPHATLLYDNQNVPEQVVDPIAWRVAEFVLVHSELGKTRHHILERWPLRA